MNALILLSCLLLPAMSQNDLLEEARGKIGEAFLDEKACDALYDKFQQADLRGSNILLGYKGALEMAKSKHASLFKKLDYFNAGKAILERAIAQDMDNIELRFLRFQIQYNTPSFLGYKDQLKNDKEFISSNLYKMESVELREKISFFLTKAEL